MYTESVDSIREAKERPRSAGSSMRHKDILSRPSILETLDFINGVKDGLCGELLFHIRSTTPPIVCGAQTFKLIVKVYEKNVL